jgi:HPt (histidine-containing phosphotransfer) domain-containing protein
MSDATIDLATFRELQETAGAEFVGELVGTFLEEAPVMLADLRGALAAGDADKFRRAAHSLKSNSNTFGAHALGAMAKDLELSGLAKVLERGPQALDPVAQEYARAAAALAKLRDA